MLIALMGAKEPPAKTSASAATPQSVISSSIRAVRIANIPNHFSSSSNTAALSGATVSVTPPPTTSYSSFVTMFVARSNPSGSRISSLTA